MDLRRVTTLGIGLGVLLLAAPAGANDTAGSVEPITSVQLAAKIDKLIAKKWEAHKVQPAPVAEDAEFIRRIYLDLVGRIPRAIEVREFLADKKTDKRERLISKLLNQPLYVTHLSATWRAVILPPSNQQFQFFGPSFKTWLDEQIAKNVPYDRLVREILTVPMDFNQPVRGGALLPNQNPNATSPIAFYQANENKAENLASAVSRVFLGVRLECAQCHNHPFAEWKREQFWELAAFFSAVQPPRPVRRGERPPPQTAPGKQIRIPGTDKVVSARLPDGNEPAFQDGVDARVTLADWVTSPQNPYFARTAVNRLWAHFFGVGLIDPVDDEPTEENPVSHPELLKELTEQFIAHKFDMKYMIRAITLSKVYQRASAVSHESQTQPRLFARMAVRGLTPEQLFDSLAQATGYYEGRAQERGGRVIVVNPLAGNGARAEFLARFPNQEKRTETHTSILQALALMNGKFIADATSIERSMTLAAAAEFPGWTTAQRIETLFLAALSRPPHKEELTRLSAYVERGGPSGDSRRALADVFWTLLNSSEFILNH